MLKQKRLLYILSVGILLALCAFPSSAADRDIPVIRVGYFNFSGYHMKSDDGRLSGYGYDFLQKIGNYMDCTYKYVGYESSYSDALEMLERGELDLVTSVSKTPEREEKFLFSDKSIGTNSTMFTVKAGNSSVVSGDYDTYDGLTIGMLDGNSKNDVFQEFADRHHFTYRQVLFETESELTAALQNEDVDGIVTGSLRTTQNEWMIETLSASDFYVVTRKDNPELMRQINNAINSLDLDDPDWRTALHRTYYSLDTGGHIMLSAQERKYLGDIITSNEKLKVLVNPDRSPYSYFEDGTAKGILPEIFSKIAEGLSLPCEFIETKDRTDYYRAREEGQADIVLDMANDFYTAEQAGYKLTSPYLNIGFTRLTLKNHSNDVRTIATLNDSDVLRDYVTRIYDSEDILYYDSVEECLDAVQKEQADATILYSYAAEEFLQQDIRNQFSFMLMEDTSSSYALGVNIQRSYLLRSILDQAISSISRDERAAIVSAETGNINLNSHETLIAFLYDNPVYGILAALFLCVFAFVCLFLFMKEKNQKLLRQKVADVSEKYEEQRLALQDALEEANTASHSKSVFLFNMSHDIRTPMNAIIGFADIAKKHLDDRDVVENAVNKIKISSDILLKLINDVLDLARIESGKTTLDPAPQNMLECEESVYLLFRESMEKAGIKFVIEHNILNPYVMCDYLRLNQISINLLSNAQKFTPKGGEVVYSISQTCAPDADGFAAYRISVKDNGIGMSKDFQARVFDQFERERTSTVSGIQGTGLGLSIVKRIVDMMHGRIEVHSEPGRGSEFVVTLRLQTVSENDVRERCVANVNRDSFPGKRILLVEDNELNREIAMEILSEEGFEIDEATDGTEAVEKVSKAPAGYYDVVLMDIQMPVMDGYKATEEIRRLEDPLRACVPIIAMTANAFEEDRKMAFDVGMNGHLAKPIDVDSLLEILHNILTDVNTIS